ncbi:hypothetical protein Q4S45_23055 [Massilia sp. R2A-15]|uniref:hypothetical protein n=1 Tax=Massilia sp. R2A-15 TaxID=3064278 RepID=UPI002735AEE0|nr:hypothetical protein [Massilia sp. R2A-15]WLI89532.1 hypothetical protein Q4S45_23055 [Massilia sp. R2A-15]
MTRSGLAAPLLLATALSACGGGGGGGGGGAAPATVTVAAASYAYVAPQAGAQLAYADTLVDNLNSTINRNLSSSVTAVGAGGGYTASEVDPSHDRIVSGAVDHTFYPTVYNYDAMGRATSWNVTGAAGVPVQCQVTGAQPAGAPSPLTAGQTWNASYVETCGAGAGIAYSQTGSFVGIETVTVPAGTFNAYKFVSTTTWSANGRTTTEAVTRWRDTAASGSRIVKSVAAFSYSGAEPPQGALVSETQTLQSFH